MLTNRPQPTFLFAMTGAAGLCGGIAGSNLNVLYALLDLAIEHHLDLTVFSYLEHDRDRPDFLPSWVTFRGFEGDKWHFTSHLLHAMRRRPIVCFDHVSLALPVLPFAATGRVKTIILTHGSEAWKHVRRTSRWSLRFATLCLANSRFTLRKMQERLFSFHGIACPLGLPPTFTRQSAVCPASDLPLVFETADSRTGQLGTRYLLMVARLDSRERGKGHRALIRLLPTLRNDIADVQLVCAGPGDDRESLRAFARRHGVASCVFFPGYVSVEILQALYRNCYAFVMPSTQEGFGLVYLEAMRYAKPCVGCFDQGAEDVIVHEETGFLLRNPHNSQSLFSILRHLLRHPQHAQWLGRNGYKRLHDGFTARQYQARLQAEIARVL
ncbi:MAG: glycosyltransferase family 4 protein [Candidatus Tectomicrobia bacterium]|nr:glycosyltransferase family 4 protein [Candidatus Tectomicrobia bacterium]